MFNTESSGCLNDDSLGPGVRGCRDNFDFTFKFQKIFLSILPASVFIALCLPRVVYLIRRPVIVKGTHVQVVKLIAFVAYSCLELAILAVSCSEATRLSYLFITSAALGFVAALCMSALSFLEHSRSPRPSMLLSGFLFLTLLFDIAQARSLWISVVGRDGVTFTRLFTAAIAIKSILIILESLQKRRWMEWDSKNHSPEETSGLYGLGAFLWLNSLFISGYNKLLGVNDLFPLDQYMSAESLQKTLSRRLEEADLTAGKYELAKILAKTLAVPLLLPVGPRIALIGFHFCQPFLIQALLNHLQEPPSEAYQNINKGLIGASVLIYTGQPISMAFYRYFHGRALFMSRGCLTAAIYKKTTEAKLSVADDSAAITLMSTDTERIRLGFENLHEFWANSVEAALAFWLLHSQLGAAFVAPIVVILVCVVITAFIGRYSLPRQKAWMEKIEKRVGLTANVIANMKHLKISGLTAPVQEAIQRMRVDELKVGGKFRMVLIMAVTIGFVPYDLAPVFTFAVTSRTLDVTTIFTSISYLTLVADPLVALFQAVPAVVAALACLGRIQAFLQTESYDDFREVVTRPETEKTPVSSYKKNSFAIKVTNGSFGWADGEFNLQDISVTIPSSGLTVVVGPIASGKSTLCKALLGETPSHQGRVLMGAHFRKVGYCDQTPFLSNGTIRENIVGFSTFDENRYKEVIEASMLGRDLNLFPQHDQTRIGSNGITLSGGQKQRVSIARALYLESDLLIFDDILSGLDLDTEEELFARVFGPAGILKQRGATTILCTHSVRHLPAADHIIALGPDGTLVEEGTFSNLVANKKYVHGLGVSTPDEGKSSGANTPPPPSEDAMPLTIAKTKSVDPAVLDDVAAQARKLGDTRVYKHYLASIGVFWVAIFLACGVIAAFFYNFPTVWLKYWSEDAVSDNPDHSTAYYLGLYSLFQASMLVSLFFFILIGLRVVIMRSGATLHQAALAAMIGAPLRFFTITDLGVVTNLFSQDMTLIDGELPLALINVSIGVLIAVGMAAIIATTSAWLLISFPIIAILLYGIQKFYLRTSRQLRLLDLETKSPLYTHFIDTIKGVATFRAFGWCNDGIILNNNLLDTSQRPAYLLSMIQQWLGLVLGLIVAVLAVVVITLATQLRANTGFTGASLVTLMYFGATLANIIRSYTLLETSLGAVSRLKSFSEDTKPETLPGEDIIPPESWPQEGRIEIKDISASYGDPEHSTDDESDRPSSPSPLALRNLDITIEPGEKVAICGRSGSGKSSTMLLLLRLLDPLPHCSANMSIDGLALHTIDRATLRRRIIAVPQDAVFLPDGTSFKANLDPFNGASEAECQDVLETVDLWDFISQRGGLGAGMAGDTLSQGQKQLFSLGRAILRRRIRERVRGPSDLALPASGKKGGTYGEVKKGGQADAAVGQQQQRQGMNSGGVLLLDEVSSSVDVETDRAMQRVIKREFEGYTVVMVSHRLEMVMDFDKVLVMDSGSVAEQGNPRSLVDTEGSRFRDLWLVGNRSAAS